MNFGRLGPIKIAKQTILLSRILQEVGTPEEINSFDNLVSPDTKAEFRQYHSTRYGALGVYLFLKTILVYSISLPIAQLPEVEEV